MQIIRERIPWEGRREYRVWNRNPGALAILPKFADNQQDLPFQECDPGDAFTAIIYSQLGSTAVLYRLLKNVARSRYLDKVIFLFPSIYRNKVFITKVILFLKLDSVTVEF